MISNDDTERTTLVDIAADHAATFWYRLKYPVRYHSIRVVNGHRISVTITDYSLSDNPITELMNDRLQDA